MNSSAQGKPGLGRVERRKLDTRARILSAAETLMRNQPIDSITIQNITESADVGHGSFYLHFKSKYEVLIPIIQKTAQENDDKVRMITSDTTDPAEIVAVSARHMGRMILSDDLWQWTLKHAAVPIMEMQNAFGRFGERDFENGVRTGRFQVNDADVVGSFALGGYVSCIMSALDKDNSAQRIDNGVEIMLRAVGLTIKEANELAHKPLPELE